MKIEYRIGDDQYWTEAPDGKFSIVGFGEVHVRITGNPLPAPGADLATDPIEKAWQLGLHADHRGYAELRAAVPASEPKLDVFGDRWHSLTCDGTCSPPCKDAPQQYVWQGDPPAPLLHLTKHNGHFYACADVDAAPAPVSGMPDLAELQLYNIDEILRGDRTLKYVKFYKAADVERLLNSTKEPK